MDTQYKKYLWSALSITTLGAFMAGLDARIVVVGLDVIISSLKADLEQGLWFTQAYMLGSTLMLLLAGKLADLYGRVKLYAYGFVLFTIGSALSGLSLTPTHLILSRFFQGIGSGILTTLSAAIITDVAAGGPLAFALSINALAFRIGSILGLTASGLLIYFFGWRSIFYVNVPVGLVGFYLTLKRLKEVYKPSEKPRIDWLGFSLITLSLLSLLLALTIYAYGLAYRSLTELLAVISLLSFLGFVVVELKTRYPLLDLSLFKIWSFTGGIIAQLLNAVAFGAVMLLLTLYLEIVLGMDPLTAGIHLLPFELSFLVFGLISGRLSDKYGYTRFALAGLIVGSFAQFLLAGITKETPLNVVLFYSMILAMGNGLFMSPNTSSIMASVPPNRRGIASAIRSVIFNVGMTISLNISVLLIASKIPYSLVTRLLIGAETMTGDAEVSRGLLAESIGYAFKVLGIINLSAAVFSITRLKTPQNTGQIKQLSEISIE
ncbi:MFS transporter [Thermofilum sp.]|uniref:MFS transporter n=1 Tax=Thermofilum sp. TaxID=1961369 RepID=UPI00258B73AA|nr:MFS transporter [Thermofilum sp.]